MDDVKHTPGERVRAYLAARATMNGTDRDAIHTVLGTFHLLEADLEALSTPLRDAAPDMLEALKLADAALSGANMNMRVVERKIKAAIAKATGGV